MVDSRAKGQRGERDFLKQLSALLELDTPLTRNLQQTRNGGCDCVELPGLAIEIKNCKTIEISKWLKQAEASAEDLGAVPILAYKERRKWRVMVPLSWLCLATFASYEEYVTVDLGCFAKVLRQKEVLLEVAA